MSSAFFHKPELALRRAQELKNINQDEAALSLLHEILSSRRNRTWSPAYEQIMITYLDLCLAMHKSREAKDGLHQYRNLSQSQAPGSLEKVIRYLMAKSEQQCTQAKASVDAETLAAETSDDADGEGFGASPQAILLSTMSTDPAKSQRDSALLLPSLKFLWETYRAILDILRSNSKLEHVYHAAAQSALIFCRTYKRRTEFRHLCDMLRIHLGNLRQYGSAIAEPGDDSKTSNKIRGWEGWSTEAIELHLQTRFVQLDTASALHRYTEGFRTVEDIYNILQISHARRKANPDAPAIKAKIMAAYYEKLTTLFWVSENYLFHAFARYKYYTLCKEFNRSMSEEMKRTQASAVLLAALCIPSTNRSGNEDRQHGITSTIEDDIVKQKMARMATLLGFHTRNPTREALLSEIRSKNILAQVPQYLRDLYLLLEDNSDPLVMIDQARPLLEQLKKDIGESTPTGVEKSDLDTESTSFSRYVQPLTSVLLLKLLINLSSAYHTVSLENLKKLTSGLDMSFEQVEKAIVLFTQNRSLMLSVRIDHRAGCLRFGNAELESDAMRSQLTVLAKQLDTVCQILNPPDKTKSLAKRSALYQDVRSNLVSEHEALLERKNLIEKRKEEIERLAQEKVREEARIKAEEEAARKAEEEKRIAREQRLREQEKHRKIQQELENQEKKRFLVAMGKNMDEISDEQMAKIDTEALQKEHQEKINKEKEEAERKTREAAKKLDYLVRAVRIEELPSIKKKYEEQIKKDRESYEQETKENANQAKAQFDEDIKAKAVLEEYGVYSYFAEFEEAVLQGRRADHEKMCREAEREAEIQAEKDKIARARKRKEDEAKRIEDEKIRQREEEERKKQEEENRKREEARREKEAKEEERRLAEIKRMEEERKRNEMSRSQPEKGKAAYRPPGQRGRPGGAGTDERGGGSRFGGGSNYPGGGRYEGRSGDSRRGGGYDDDRRGGSRFGYDDRDRGGGSRYQGGDRRDRDRDRDDRNRPPPSSENTRWR